MKINGLQAAYFDAMSSHLGKYCPLNEVYTELVLNQTRLFELIKWSGTHKGHVRLTWLSQDDDAVQRTTNELTTECCS